MKPSKGAILTGVAIVCLLTVSFFWNVGGDKPESDLPVTIEASPSPSPVASIEPTPEATPEATPMSSVEASPTPKATTTPVPKQQAPAAATPTPTPPPTQETPTAMTCALTIRCDTLLENIGNLKKEKQSLVPADGVIFMASDIVFHEEETVFQVLQREAKRARIHLEFEQTPGYQSSYIEGIANLYEMDCGPLSGWMYKVNGEFPNFGCSRYLLKPGDVIEWVYTCDLGHDIGGSAAAGKQR